MLPWFTERFGNPHSAEHGMGQDAAAAVEDARRRAGRTPSSSNAATPHTIAASATLNTYQDNPKACA